MQRVVVASTEAEARRVRPLVVRAYEECRARRWPFLSDVLASTARGAGEEDRAVVAAIVVALVKYDRLLDFASGSRQAEAHLDALLSMANGATDVEARLERIEGPDERLGVTYSFPDWLVQLVRVEMGESALLPALARMNDLAPRVVRVNALRVTRAACLASLAEEGVSTRPTTRAGSGLVIEGRRSVFRTKAFARGEVEMQDEASQLVADLVAPPPRSFVVDACAGAGGKTLALASLLGGKGKLVAIDTSKVKLEELRRRARRAGASNVQALEIDVCQPGRELSEMDGRALRVLVDAPCTGLGAIRRNPEVRWRLTHADVLRLRAAQAALASAAARLVAPNGRLVYATCSFLPSEGTDAVHAFLSEHRDFELFSARGVLGRARTEGLTTTDGKSLCTWRCDGTRDGGDEGMDGFFAAVMRRAKA